MHEWPHWGNNTCVFRIIVFAIKTRSLDIVYAVLDYSKVQLLIPKLGPHLDKSQQIQIASWQPHCLRSLQSTLLHLQVDARSLWGSWQILPALRQLEPGPKSAQLQLHRIGVHRHLIKREWCWIFRYSIAFWFWLAEIWAGHWGFDIQPHKAYPKMTKLCDFRWHF